MKRVLLILVVFFLIGCEDKKITKEYLDGEWICSIREYESSHREKDKDAWIFTDEYEDIETYKLLDGKLHIVNENEEFIPFDIDDKIANNSIELPINNGKNGMFKINHVYKKNNENEYTYTVKTECSIKTDLDNNFYLRKKIISSCGRLK